MGWPKADEQFRLYQERGDKTYILVAIEGSRTSMQDAVANMYPGPSPSLGGTLVSRSYLQSKCQRVSWRDLPANWQAAFLVYMRQGGQDWDPQKIRGLWHTGGPPRGLIADETAREAAQGHASSGGPDQPEV